MLIGHTHSSQFMEWQNLGFTTRKHAICAPNIFKKLPENQTNTNFIDLKFSNFLTISHIDYWDQVNSWKSLWKFWNRTFFKRNSGPFPHSILQDIGRVATPKLVQRNCLRYLQTTLIIAGERGSSQNLRKVLPKVRYWKKVAFLFSLDPLFCMSGIRQMILSLIELLLDQWPSKILKCRNYGEI